MKMLQVVCSKVIHLDDIWWDSDCFRTVKPCPYGGILIVSGQVKPCPYGGILIVSGQVKPCQDRIQIDSGQVKPCPYSAMPI
jgi:hypothetical protein